MTAEIHPLPLDSGEPPEWLVELLKPAPPALRQVTVPSTAVPSAAEDPLYLFAGSAQREDGIFLPHADKKLARARKKGEQQRRADDRKAAQKAAMDEKRRLRDELRGATPVPKKGEARPLAGRVVRALRVPSHRATSAVLQGAYPFQAGQGWGSRGMFIGQDAHSRASVTYDPWELYASGILTNPNILIAGVIGQGKSSLAKTLVTRGAAFGRQAYIPGDPKGEWGPLVQAIGGVELHLGRGLKERLNPLDTGVRDPAMTDGEWEAATRSRRADLVRALLEVTLKRPLQPIELTSIELAVRGLSTVTERTGLPPTLSDLAVLLREPSPEQAEALNLRPEELSRDARDVLLTVQRLVTGDLGGLFDGQTTTPLDLTKPAVSVNLSRLEADDTMLPLVMTLVQAWMESAISDPNTDRKRWVIYDEAWRLMKELPLVRRMQSQFKLARAFGVSNVVIMHRLADLLSVGDANSEQVALAQGLLADASTRIVYRQESDQLADAASRLGLTGVETALLGQLTRGQALWRVGSRAAVVAHQLGVTEAQLVNTDARMV